MKTLVATMAQVQLERSSDETETQRWQRLYRIEGGPLVAWLLDEAAVQMMDLHMLARELGVTVGYLSQLHSGLRSSADISHSFAAACGVFLKVPSVVVQVVAGRLTLLDFVSASDLDRWSEQFGVETEGRAAQHVCGARLGQEELWLLPHIVRALLSVASVHETRARLA